MKAGLKPEEQKLIELLEKDCGPLSEQEIRLALEQAKAIGEI